MEKSIACSLALVAGNGHSQNLDLPVSSKTVVLSAGPNRRPQLTPLLLAAAACRHAPSRAPVAWGRKTRARPRIRQLRKLPAAREQIMETDHYVEQRPGGQRPLRTGRRPPARRGDGGRRWLEGGATSSGSRPAAARLKMGRLRSVVAKDGCGRSAWRPEMGAERNVLAVEAGRAPAAGGGDGVGT